MGRFGEGGELISCIAVFRGRGVGRDEGRVGRVPPIRTHTSGGHANGNILGRVAMPFILEGGDWSE